MSDYIVKALGYEGEVRAYAIRSTETVKEAQRRHDTWATASAALGRTLTASAMMGTMLKDNDRITVKIEGDGPIRLILVDASANGKVRGYVANPHVHFDLNEKGKLDVRRAVGTNGMLTVIKDLGLKEKFSGQVPLVSGEIGEDFTYYFATSEQTPSAVGVGVLVNPDHTILASGGFIIQIMPGATDSTISEIENRLNTIKPISTMIREGMTPEEILEELLGDNIKVLETVPVEFECTCSKERFGNALIGLGSQELQEMIDEDEQAEAQCHFCNEKYLFTKEELEEYKRLAEEK
ncbi:Hsp33 family molecular chaperone HslO [Caldibacillus thermolactis]|jgi:molecular chaperone Hsp33|uniref:33 kDa chaperonin n=1 Tax=Pallidibacillus thermolactis TaxID=251051 RepID=A0ABT2WFS4_9BACI|nr:Hsp33 family molecular chaperone HslO [Pallidibacillus thermolactis]MCU9594350.1 Hsp33 family molecular chaperone HslO [Pallidibacillus thermolactis]MCU9601547.1 Hsp33 family molecular chaperone HslO [Pallidibacillus thermolactis subsp. kokeshiiformis]MED1672496.1 Hsp33 family molecular chaperone HslO [Pallidibacillus thermolactis subsp. kokeshiiformis]